MESYELRKIDIENRICYYYDDIININDPDLENILLDEKSYKNMSIYHVTYAIPKSVKLSRVVFNEVNGYIKDYAGTKHLALFPLDEK